MLSAQLNCMSRYPPRVVEGGSTANPQHFGIHEQLQRLHGRYDQLVRAVEQTADAVMLTNRQGVIEYVNPAFEETTGFPVNEALGRTPNLLKSGMHDERFYKELWAQLITGKPFRGIIINRKKSGQLYWTAQTISSMKDEHGEITHFVSVLKDLTELRKQQEQEFHLRIAHAIQQRLNTTVAWLPGFDIAGTVCSAMLTGGDYFDFVAQPDGCLCVAIGDVSGHGFGAALVMAETRAYVRSYAMLEADTGAILSRVNKALVALDMAANFFLSHEFMGASGLRGCDRFCDTVLRYASSTHSHRRVHPQSGQLCLH